MWYHGALLLARPVWHGFLVKGIFRDHSRDKDFCILEMVLDGMNLTLKGIVKICPRLITKRY